MLSEEEKEAIKILLEFRDYYAREDINRENFNNEENYKKALNGIKILKNSFDTVINLITRLQKENEHWKNGFERELEDNRKNTCELLKQDLEIREKDKQIDLMAEFLGERDLGHYKNEIGGEILGIMRKYNKEDWKQYFEKLAKENK